MRGGSTALDSSPPTLVHLLRARAVRQPDDLALTFLGERDRDGQACTYGELDRRSRAVAVRLRELGLKPGDRVLLLCPPGFEYVAELMGCLYAGLTVVPAYPPDLARLTRTMPRLISIIQDSQPSVVLTTSAGLAAAKAFGDHAHNSRSLHWCAIDDVEIALADGWQHPALGADSLALLQYTSGSTATPRGVMVTHGNLMHNLAFIRRSFEVGPDDVGVIWLPPYHDMGLIGGILGAFYCGNPLVLFTPVAFLKRPMRWLEIISQTRAVISGAPNFAYELCIRRIGAEDRARLDLTSWAVAFVGAEPVRAHTIDRFTETFAECGFRREAFFPCYGLAEATLMASGGRKGDVPANIRVCRHDLQQGRVVRAAADEQAALRLVGCGRSPDDQEMVIVDPETCTPCPPERVGEIWLSGPSIARGYWNRPEESRRTFEAFLADTGRGPYLRTGDLALLDDGELFITGRLRDLVICDGRNHYPEDIEQTVEQSHRALRAGGCAAFSVDVDGTERLVILAEISVKHESAHIPTLTAPAREDEGNGASAGVARRDLYVEVSQAVRRAVTERHDLRAHIVLLVRPGDLFKTSSGKIQRQACRAAFLTGTLAGEPRSHEIIS